MTDATLTMLVLAGITYALKATGPLLLGGERQLPPMIDRLAVLLPAPLLAALVTTSAFVDDQQWTLDARAVGLVVAALALWRRLPFVVVIVVAAAATALVRAVA